MPTALIVDALIDIGLTVLVMAALVFTCAAMYPPRPPRGPRP
ncbi:hypothetical protein [Saccharothrix deserti]|nr:hypothetical protein [Saccharothrix deserti]